MKKLLLVALILALLTSSCIGLAEDVAVASYASTQSFLDVCADNEVYCMLINDLEGSTDELVRIDSYDTENQTTVCFYIYFDEEQRHAYIRAWDIIEFQESDRGTVLEILNQMNHDFSYLTGFAEDDNTVSIKYDIIFTDADDAGLICLEAMSRIASILRRVYPALVPYAQ